MKHYKYHDIEVAVLTSLMALSLEIGYRLLDFSSLVETIYSILEITSGIFFSYSFYKVHKVLNDDLYTEIFNNFMLQAEFK